MQKREFINILQEKLGGCTKKQCETIIDAFTGSLEEVLTSGDEIRFTNFGTFKTRTVKAHDGVNPRTKEIIHHNAKTIPFLKFSKSLKDSVDSANGNN